MVFGGEAAQDVGSLIELAWNVLYCVVKACHIYLENLAVRLLGSFVVLKYFRLMLSVCTRKCIPSK